MSLSIAARMAVFIVLLGGFGKGWALEYAYEDASLVVNDRGAWVKNKGNRVALIPQLNDALRSVLQGRQYKNIRKQAILVSIVGPYASFRLIKSALPNGRPLSVVARSEGQVFMRVIDIRHPLQPQSPVSLLNIFTELQIRDALEKSPDDDLRSAYIRFDKSYKLEALSATGLPADGDFLYEFAFDVTGGDKVDIKVQRKSPGFGDGLDRDAFFTLKFKMPEKLAACLEKANTKNSGYLISNSQGDNDRPSFFFK